MIRIRSWLVPLAALLLLLGFQGCAGSSKGKTSGARKVAPYDPTNPTVAVVAGRPITKRDVDSVLAAAPASIREDYLDDPEQYKILVERIAQQEMLLLAARKAGVERDPAYLADLAAQQRSALMKHYYQKVVASLPPVPDSEVRKYYDEHASEFQMPGRVRVRHIQVKTQSRAREVIRALKKSSWSAACERYSTDKVTAKSGGLLGFVISDGDQVPGVGKAPAIVAAAFTLKEGETSAPLKSEKAWHVIRVDERTQAGPQPFANVERQIRGNLEGERSERFQQSLIDSLKKEYGVVVHIDSLESAMKPNLTPAQLFAKAQTAENPKERIALFREVVTRYPSDKSSVQAAFMIGFTYAEELRDFPAARTAFQEFIRTYPKSDLVASANWMLENMENSVPPPSVGLPDTLKIETFPAPGAIDSTRTPQKL